MEKDKEKLRKRISEIADTLERVTAEIFLLEAELKAKTKYQCNCQVEYTGCHIWPCKGK